MNLLKAVEIFFTLAAVVGGPLLAVMIVPGLARKFLKSHSTPETPPAEVDEARTAEVEQLSRRIAELEERLDFAERLLAQQREANRIAGGR